MDKKKLINDKVLIFLSPSADVNGQSLKRLSDKEAQNSEFFVNFDEFSKLRKLDTLFNYGTIYFFGGDIKSFNRLINFLDKYDVRKNVNQNDVKSLKNLLHTLPKDKGFVFKHTVKSKK